MLTQGAGLFEFDHGYPIATLFPLARSELQGVSAALEVFAHCFFQASGTVAVDDGEECSGGEHGLVQGLLHLVQRFLGR